MDRLSFEKVFYHLDHLNSYLKTGDTYPVHMIVGLTNICNHSCIFCYGYDTISERYNENAFAPVDMVVGTITEAAQLGLRSVSLVGTGEPALHPKFAEIVRRIKSTGVDVGLFTNGFLIGDENKVQAIIDTHTFIRLSCSGADREEHNRIHHAGKPVNDFDQIVKNIRTLINMRGRKLFPTIGVQFVASHHNWQSLLRACHFWKDVGVDYYAIKPAYKNPNITKHEENEAPLEKVIELMKEAKALEDETFTVHAKYQQFNKVLAIKDYRGYDKCHGQAFVTFLDPDGKLYVCGNMHGKKEYCLGNVRESDSFETLWDGKRRKQILRDLDVSTCPIGCRMDPLNLIIEDLINPDYQIHTNFL